MLLSVLSRSGDAVVVIKAFREGRPFFDSRIDETERDGKLRSDGEVAVVHSIESASQTLLKEATASLGKK